MSNPAKSLNDTAWEKIFNKYRILSEIDANGVFVISANQIKEFREPRLMAKFDHTINLPKIFSENDLSILPTARGEYMLSHFQAYHSFEPQHAAITRYSLPEHIQSLDPNNVTSEAIALNCAIASGLIADFLGEELLVATVSGRMSSGDFSFNIRNSRKTSPIRVDVCGSQIEIDAAYEGIESLALFEAKRDLSEDFLIRQLYYPFRLWESRVTKKVRPLFLVYSNSIYRLFEYSFQDIDDYNSLVLVNQRNYSIEDTSISLSDIEKGLSRIQLVAEPEAPFPQADSFERVINICELLSEQSVSRNEITEQYAFDARQTNYYTDAARYLDLLEKSNENRVPVYQLSPLGKRIMKLGYKQRQIAFCNCILSHKVFYNAFIQCLNDGQLPSKSVIIEFMKGANLFNIDSESTFERRSSTIREWLKWILELIDE